MSTMYAIMLNLSVLVRWHTGDDGVLLLMICIGLGILLKLVEERNEGDQYVQRTHRTTEEDSERNG